MDIKKIYPAALCAIMLMGAGVKGSDANNTDANGPTITIGYSENDVKKNPIPSFMYFVPLISPVDVTRETSAGNNGMGWIISYKQDGDENKFSAACEFKMEGGGYHVVKFDASGMIERNIKNLKEGEPLKNVLDYIRFEGEGAGLFEVKGMKTDSKETINEVIVSFKNGGDKSPVTVGLYSIKPVDGKYKYENRYDELIARVNKLEFKRTEGEPKMGIDVASVRKKAENEGVKSDVVGMIANFFINPLEVDKKGNDAMLDFGYAIYKKQLTFTFPKATNITKDVNSN